MWNWRTVFLYKKIMAIIIGTFYLHFEKNIIEYFMDMILLLNLCKTDIIVELVSLYQQQDGDYLAHIIRAVGFKFCNSYIKISNNSSILVFCILKLPKSRFLFSVKVSLKESTSQQKVSLCPIYTFIIMHIHIIKQTSKL